MPSAVDPQVPADASGSPELAQSFPVLWIFGPPGVGNSTVAWQIFTACSGAETRSGYVDIDQLGICYQERSNDPGRHQLQVANLAAVIDNYRAAGARCVVVSGVVDAERG